MIVEARVHGAICSRSCGSVAFGALVRGRAGRRPTAGGRLRPLVVGTLWFHHLRTSFGPLPLQKRPPGGAVGRCPAARKRALIPGNSNSDRLSLGTVRLGGTR